MDPRKRTLLVVAIAVTIIIGLVSSFGLPLFFQTPEIVLPSIGDHGQSGENPGDFDPGEDANYTLVRVTQETVQDVIATLHRKESYYRELSFELYWSAGGETQGATGTALIWNDGAYSKTAIIGADGTLRNCLKAQDSFYIWYGSDKTWFTYTADEADLDLVQRIPTYEDVLDLDPAEITRTGYEAKEGKNCIFVERSIPEPQYLERYWISTESGLLVAAETEKDGSIVYRMTEKMSTALGAGDAVFSLPDGTVLHRVVTSETKE